jgi:dihydrofolate reductase
MTNFVYIATSLDGYIAAADGGIDWLNEMPNPSDNDYGFGEFMDKIDAIVMGRNTFETVVSFGVWPYERPVFVLTNSLEDIPDGYKDKAAIVQSEVVDLVHDLNARGYENLYVDGGLTIQSFLQQDLIDELIITRIPILLGSGISLFGQLDTRLRFRHMQTDVYDNSMVKSRYARSRE